MKRSSKTEAHNTILRKTKAGKRDIVSFVYKARRYQATLDGGSVTALHSIHGDPEVWRSISPSNERRYDIIDGMRAMLRAEAEA